MTLICLGLQQGGVLTESITEEHYHDLGKWMFALTVFWTYIAFSQYLLIWYANIPEETIFFQHRMVGSWGLESALLLFGRFVIPFAFLLRRVAEAQPHDPDDRCDLDHPHAHRGHVLAGDAEFQQAGVQPHWMDLGGCCGVVSVLASFSGRDAPACDRAGGRYAVRAGFEFRERLEDGMSEELRSGRARQSGVRHRGTKCAGRRGLHRRDRRSSWWSYSSASLFTTNVDGRAWNEKVHAVQAVGRTGDLPRVKMRS